MEFNNTFFGVLEPRERVLLLQMLFSLASAPSNPSAGFEGPLRGGREERGKGRKKNEGIKHPIPRNKFLQLCDTLTLS